MVLTYSRPCQIDTLVREIKCAFGSVYSIDVNRFGKAGFFSVVFQNSRAQLFGKLTEITVA